MKKLLLLMLYAQIMQAGRYSYFVSDYNLMIDAGEPSAWRQETEQMSEHQEIFFKEKNIIKKCKQQIVVRAVWYAISKKDSRILDLAQALRHSSHDVAGNEEEKMWHTTLLFASLWKTIHCQHQHTFNAFYSSTEQLGLENQFATMLIRKQDKEAYHSLVKQYHDTPK